MARRRRRVSNRGFGRSAARTRRRNIRRPTRGGYRM